MRICIDSRKIKKGEIFVPVKGEKYDGHSFIKEALKKGAKKVWDIDLGKLAHDYKKKYSIPIIAITGSSGKTTVKDLLHSVLSQKYKVLKSKENENNQIGLPLTLLKLNSQYDLVILEMAMRNSGDIEYLTKIAEPTHIIITNIGLTHIERLKSQLNIVKAKSEIFNNNSENKKYAYLNKNTGFLGYLKKSARRSGYKIRFFSGNNAFSQNKDLVEKVAKDFSLKKEQIKKGINKWKPSNNRMEFLTLKNNVLIINDSYNANPDSMKAAMNYFGKYKGRKIAVLGDMLELGSISKREHIKLGKLLRENNVNYLFSFGKFAKMIKFGNKNKINISNHKKLFLEIVKYLKPRDTILVKGSRGMKLDIVVNSLVSKYKLKKKEYFKY